MQLKCTFCSTPFALSNDQVAEAIEILKKDPHAHYDAHCPRCRRANKLSLKMFEVNPVYRRMLHSQEPPAAEAAPPAEEKPAAKAAKPAEKKPSAKAAK
jgi:phage FluMu protein Com